MDDSKLIGIVDDEASIRVALTRLCSAYGLIPHAYASAQQLFDDLREGGRVPDCLLLDVHMPGMCGLDVQEWLRARSIRIPTIMMTGREDNQLRARAFALGASAYLFKPVDGDVLLRAISDAMAAAG